jgi:hypothetical protein
VPGYKTTRALPLRTILISALEAERNGSPKGSYVPGEVTMRSASGERAISTVEGPDFICIGMPKAGTGWLFDQLQYHPDFWMPPIKEIHYLNHEYPPLRNAARWLERKERQQGGGPKDGGDPPRRRPGDNRDIEFLQDASALSKQKRDIGRYAALFKYKNGMLSGDVSPAYSALEDEVIAEIAEALPDTKIALLVRDPVARAWSRVSMFHRDGEFDEGLMDDPKGFRAFLDNSEKIQGRSLPSKIVEAWKRAAPQMQFQHFMFDDIASEPEKARREILVYLGGDPDKKSGAMAANFNRKASASKLDINDKARAVLVDYFRDELKACAAMFGPHAQNWATQYGV